MYDQIACQLWATLYWDMQRCLMAQRLLQVLEALVFVIGLFRCLVLLVSYSHDCTTLVKIEERWSLAREKGVM